MIHFSLIPIIDPHLIKFIVLFSTQKHHMIITSIRCLSLWKFRFTFRFQCADLFHRTHFIVRRDISIKVQYRFIDCPHAGEVHFQSCLAITRCLQATRTPPSAFASAIPPRTVVNRATPLLGRVRKVETVAAPAARARSRLNSLMI
jgi:hypothetical protein